MAEADDPTLPSISIHAPREGSDNRDTGHGIGRSISIHAPREGSDCGNASAPSQTKDFYPRSPRGERPAAPAGTSLGRRFLSTLPARGATSLPQ